MITAKKFSLAKFAILALLCAALFAGIAAPRGSASAATDFKSVGKAAYLIDAKSGYVMYAKNENARLPIASMMKIMTAQLVLEDVEAGKVGLDDDVTVSAQAASMGGSQVFLEEGDVHKLKDLLRTVIVASANDSCVALAEHLEGSVDAFVNRMNLRAKELGMNDTSFKNCTGLPAPESFSSAKDVATMFSALIRHPLYFEYAKVWMEDYKHPDGRITQITNTNKLVRFYKGCDGGKTGYTGEAKFCLSATAERDGMRVIAVMIGADSAKERNAAVSAMFDHAFADFKNEVLVKKGDLIENGVKVVGGKSRTLKITAKEDVTRFMPRGESAEHEVRYELPATVKAPVKEGDAVGKIVLVKDGAIVCEVDAVAAETVEKMNFFDVIVEIGKHWNTGRA